MWRKKTQLVKKVKNSNCDKTEKHKLWQSSKTQIETKFKKKTQIVNKKTKRVKLWQNLKTQIVNKLKANCDKTQKNKLGQNLKTQMVTVVIMTVVTVPVIVRYPILDTRISFSFSVTLRVPPHDSETGWTGELWSDPVLLILEN